MYLKFVWLPNWQVNENKVIFLLPDGHEDGTPKHKSYSDINQKCGLLQELKNEMRSGSERGNLAINQRLSQTFKLLHVFDSDHIYYHMEPDHR